MKEPLETVTGAGHRLGEFIRDQRRGSQISLRQLAALAGVSNPYLSQIERGLRKPSAEILQQIAKGLRISAEALYLQAGILEHRDGDRLVVDAVLSDTALSERQKQVLLEIYDSFRKENAADGVRVVPVAPHPALESKPALEFQPEVDFQPEVEFQPEVTPKPAARKRAPRKPRTTTATTPEEATP